VPAKNPKTPGEREPVALGLAEALLVIDLRMLGAMEGSGAPQPLFVDGRPL